MLSIVAMIGLCQILRLLTKNRYIAILPLMTVSLIVGILFLAAYFSAALFFAKLLIYLGYAGIVLICVDFFSNRRLKLKPLLDPGLIFFFAAVSIVALKYHSATYTMMDEYSFWGLVTKEMARTGAFVAANSSVSVKDLPPGSNLMHLFVIAGATAREGFESLTILGNSMIVVAALASLFHGLSWRTDKLGILLLTVASPYLVLEQDGMSFGTIYVDHILMTMFAAVIVGYFSVTRRRRLDIWWLLPILFAMPLMREKGIYVTLAAVSVIIIDMVCQNLLEGSRQTIQKFALAILVVAIGLPLADHFALKLSVICGAGIFAIYHGLFAIPKVLKTVERKKLAIIVGIILLLTTIPLLSNTLNELRLTRSGISRRFTTMSLSGFQEIFALNPTQKMNHIISNFRLHLMHIHAHKLALFSLSFFVLIKLSKDMIRMHTFLLIFSTLCVCFWLYCAGLHYTYAYFFTDFQASQLDSVDRYLSIFVCGTLLTGIGILIHLRSDLRSFLFYKWVVRLDVLMLATAFLLIGVKSPPPLNQVLNIAPFNFLLEVPPSNKKTLNISYLFDSGARTNIVEDIVGMFADPSSTENPSYRVAREDMTKDLKPYADELAKGARTWIIDQGTAGIAHRVLEFQFYPIRVQSWCWSIKPDKSDFPWDCIKKPEDWRAEILNNWDYVYLYKVDEEFIRSYAKIFNFKDFDQSKVRKLYKVSKETERLEALF